MKKLITLSFLSLMLYNQQAAAQISKGEKMLGGNISAFFNKIEYDNTPNKQRFTEISVSPQLGFGTGKNWIVGVSAGYTYGRQKMDGIFGNNSNNRSYVVSGGLFARKFFPIKDRFGVFGQADGLIGFGKAKYKSDSNPEDVYKINNYSISVKPGAYYRLGRRFILETRFGNLGYTHSETDPEGIGNTVKSGQFSFSLTNSLTFGFQMVL
ncbi:MAG TPA: outer membrane beta-barrel protein [Chitinophagaceae bacterium]